MWVLWCRTGQISVNDVFAVSSSPRGGCQSAVEIRRAPPLLDLVRRRIDFARTAPPDALAEGAMPQVRFVLSDPFLNGMEWQLVAGNYYVLDYDAVRARCHPTRASSMGRMASSTRRAWSTRTASGILARRSAAHPLPSPRRPPSTPTPRPWARPVDVDGRHRRSKPDARVRRGSVAAASAPAARPTPVPHQDSASGSWPAVPGDHRRWTT